MLGLRLRGGVLSIDPCIPHDWPKYSMTLRYHSALYEITVENPSGVSRGVRLCEVDGKSVAGPSHISLEDDGGNHQVRVVLG
jgi:cyclic beta-1,2-glucan synthetase